MLYPFKLSKVVMIVVIGLVSMTLIWLTSPPVKADGPQGVEVPRGRYEESAQDIEAFLESYGASAAPAGTEVVVPAAPGILTEAKAPAIGTNFIGIGQQSAGGFLFSPPDTHAATGPNSIVEVTNGHVGIYNKTGGLIAGGDSGGGAVTLNGFCGIALGCFDPKVIYDQFSGRFVAVVLEGKTSATSKLHIMVSKTNNPTNLTTDWDKFVHNTGATINGNPSWFDYPGLGVSPDAVVVTGNMFQDTINTFQGTKIRVFDKTELYDGDATATYQDIDRTSAQGGFTVQPAHHLSSPPSGTFYMFQRVGPTTLAVTTLTGVPAAPTVNALTLVTTADQGPCVNPAPQQGTTKEIDTVCPRMMNAVWRNNSLWGTLTGSDTTDSRAVVQWFEYDTSTMGATLKQHGTIDGGTGEFTFMPSISVDPCGNAALTYTQSSSNRFPEMRYTGRAAGDAANTMQTPVVAKASAFFFDDFTGPPERWGDYSSTVIDPVDNSFWVTHEYARVAASGGGNNGRWGTWHANFTFNCDTTPPQVGQVNSNQDTGDGSLGEGETATVDITQLLVTFDEAVQDPGGDTGADDVTNPNNYRLFNDGTDGTFQTSVCGAAQGDDQAITINSVTYNGGTRVATLNVNGGTKLPDDSYRLLVCGSTSIKDVAGHSLDGNGDGTGGDDFTRNFSVDMPPQVGQVNSNQDTGDGSLGEGETATVDITQLLVTFDEAVQDPGGDTGADDVTNPNNYRLFNDGTDGTFQTSVCGAAQGDDQAITINSVTYNGGTRMATLNVNGGTKLPGDSYRLLVCGSTSIKDVTGHSLDGNGDGTGGDDFIRNFSVQADTTPPQVGQVGSNQDTGDGSLGEGETATVDITQLLVTFDEAVQDPGGDTGADDVTNPNNYRLFNDGTDGTFQTSVCGAAQGDDQAITINSVTYNGGTRMATLNVNGGTKLPGDSYRLLVCGSTSIKDVAGNSLDGNGDGTGGDDFTRNFSVSISLYLPIILKSS